MRVVAHTQAGCLIEATKEEVQNIVAAVTGSKPKEIEIGQKIPAIDYGATITKVRSLKENYEFRKVLEGTRDLQKHVDILNAAVQAASLIE